MPGGGGVYRRNHYFKSVKDAYILASGTKTPENFKSKIHKEWYRESLDTIITDFSSKTYFTEFDMSTFVDSDANLDRLKPEFRNAVKASGSTFIYESNKASVPKYILIRDGSVYEITNKDKFEDFLNALFYKSAQALADYSIPAPEPTVATSLEDSYDSILSNF